MPTNTELDIVATWLSLRSQEAPAQMDKKESSVTSYVVCTPLQQAAA